MIEVDISHRQGEFALDMRFKTQAGITAIFGPSGAGKSTLMQIIAGLVRPNRARIVVDGLCWNDTASGVFLPPHKRRIGYVFQEGRLFPHLTVRQNLLFGRFFAPADQKQVDLDEIVSLLGIGPLLGKRPNQLSGGEKSRAAIGRALLMSPRLLLMDEPLASLDQARKNEILPYIETIRKHPNIPILYVSHAQAEVRRLADHVILLDGGRIVGEGDVTILNNIAGP